MLCFCDWFPDVFRVWSSVPFTFRPPAVPLLVGNLEFRCCTATIRLHLLSAAIHLPISQAALRLGSDACLRLLQRGVAFCPHDSLMLLHIAQLPKQVLRTSIQATSGTLAWSLMRKDKFRGIVPCCVVGY